MHKPQIQNIDGCHSSKIPEPRIRKTVFEKFGYHLLSVLTLCIILDYYISSFNGQRAETFLYKKAYTICWDRKSNQV